MKIAANAGMLAGALALAASLIGDRTAKLFSVLGLVHLKAAGDTLTVTTNVLDHCLTLSAPVEVVEEGELALPAARLHALLAGFPSSAEITIESAGGIRSGRSRFRLPALPVAELPAPLAITEESGRIELARADVLALLRPAFAMSREQTRYYMCGLLLRDGDGVIESVATDGHRLARVSVPGSGLSSDDHLIVPAPAVEIIGKLIGKDIEAVSVRCSRTLVAFEAGAFSFTSKLIDGNYPDYRRLIPAPGGNSAVVDRVLLLQALGRIAAVAEDRRQRIAGLRWDVGDPALQLCLADAGDAAHDMVEAEVCGHGAVAVTTAYLAEMVEAVAGQRVRLDSRSAGDPVLITGADDGDNFTGITMPYRWAALSQAAE